MDSQARSQNHAFTLETQAGTRVLICDSRPETLDSELQPRSINQQRDYLKFLAELSPTAQQQLVEKLAAKNSHKPENLIVQKRYQVFDLPRDHQLHTHNDSAAAEIGTVANAQTKPASPSTLSAHAGAAVEIKSSSGPATSSKVKTAPAQKQDAGSQAADKPATDDTPCDGDPISMVSGEELLPLTDFELPGPIAFAWTRTYRSSNPKNLGLGHGWTHPLCERLKVDGELLHYDTQEGRRITFNCPRVGHSSYNKSEKLSLKRQSEHCYQVLESQKPIRLFRADGLSPFLPLVEIRDHFNNSIGIDYQQGAPHKLVTSWGRTLEFTCNSKGLITSILAPSLATAEAPELAQLASYDYDDADDLVSACDQTGLAETYGYTNHVIDRRTTHAGVSFLFEWDQHTPEARCQRQWSDNGAYDYRFKWQPKRKISYSTDSRGNVHQYHCDEHGRVVKEIDPEGGITKRLYDSYGNLCSETDPNGNSTYYRHDSLGKITRVTDALGNSTRIRYNHQGQPALITDALGNHWQRRYNEQGLLSEIRDPNNNHWQYHYNNRGQLETLIDPEGGKQRFSWNSQAELISQTDADGRTTEYDYDNWGRVNRITTPDGKTTAYEFNRRGKLTQLTQADGTHIKLSYNDAGQVTHHTDAEGKTTQYHYGGFSQVERRIDASGQTFDYQYDEERNLIGLTNEKGERYQLSYDGNERLVEERGFDGRQQQYRYNAAGQLIEHRDMDVITQFTRDPLGRLLRKSNNSGDSAEFHYDALGRLTAANNADAFVRFQYDNAGRLTAEHCDSDTLEATAHQNSASSAHSHSLRHSYDKRGWRTATSTDDHHLGFQHTPAGQLYGVDHNGNPVVRCEYDAAGQLSKKVQGSLTSEFDYDSLGRVLQQKTTASGDSDAVIQRNYQYSHAGNLQQIEDLLRGITQYHYDHNDQLSKVEGAVAEAFSFDPAGNLLNDDKGQALYDSGNRLTLHGDRHFHYDKRGNLTEEKRGKEQRLSASFRYNGWNQLASVEKNGLKTKYRYDALGRRIGKTVTHAKTKQQKKTTFRWNGDQLWSETNHTPKGQDDQLYIFEPNSFRPLALIKDDEIHHYHLDHLGTPQEITNSQGDIVWQAQYKAYGQLVGFSKQPEISNPLRFQGQYFDSESGLHYNRHRYYDPSVGRFVHQDPVGLLGGTNNYQYAPNPVGWVDPFGLKCKEIITYRGDTRPPETIFSEGFQTKGDNTDLYQYAAVNTPSIYLSTTTNIDVAVEFATKYGCCDGYVYAVRSSNGIDVNRTLGSQSPWPEEAEIAIPHGAKSDQILGATFVSANETFANHTILNPEVYG
ncbi:MAG: RHS repeat-associated core domain-containing protein [Cellvibrionaceae bacterium]